MATLPQQQDHKPLFRLLILMLNEADMLKATKVHLFRNDKIIVCEYEVDGVWRTVESPPLYLWHNLANILVTWAGCEYWRKGVKNGIINHDAIMSQWQLSCEDHFERIELRRLSETEHGNKVHEASSPVPPPSLANRFLSVLKTIDSLVADLLDAVMSLFFQSTTFQEVGIVMQKNNPIVRYVDVLLYKIHETGGGVQELKAAEPPPLLERDGNTFEVPPLLAITNRLKVLCCLDPIQYVAPVSGKMDLQVGQQQYLVQCHFDDHAPICCRIEMNKQ